MKMRYLFKYLFISIMPGVFMLNSSRAQQPDVFKNIDSISYVLYQNGQWNSLSKIGKQAFKDGIDYYYLRMRTGIAKYEREQYRTAIRHFKKAINFNGIDPVAAEYMYYSSLFSGQRAEALLIYAKNKNLLKSKIKDPAKPVASFSFDLASHFNSETDQRSLINKEVLAGLEGYQSITRRYIAGDFLLSHDLSHRLSFFHGGSYLQKFNYYYTQSATNSFDTYEQWNRQLQYYGGLSINPGGRFSIKTTAHFINYQTPEINYRDRRFGTSFNIPSENENYWLGRVSVNKNFWLINAGAGVTLSNLNNKNQVQTDVKLILYPFGNLDLYLISSGIIVNEKYSAEKTDNRIAFIETMGLRMTRSIWLESTLYHGEFRNISISDGFIIFNGNETTNIRGDISILIPINKAIFSLRTSLMKYSSNFVNTNGTDSGLNTLHFTGCTIISGLSWNF